uniref:Fibronectin type-III domain-containing protein n=1 Tax=Biomphalaria glabrata TaxID=6526 RepID=A0A2C9LG38_BIOGL
MALALGNVDLCCSILLLLMCSGCYQSYILSPDGVVYPADPFKFVGETLELYCNITNPNIRENASSLFFERQPFGPARYDVDYYNRTTVIPSKYVESLTTKTIRLRLDNVQLSDGGKYICKLKTYQTDQFIGNQIVKVDLRPGKITDFHCRVINWESMNCTWDLSVNYKHLEHINVSLVYTYDGTQEDCPNLGLTSCMWPPESYHHGHIYYVKIVVSTVNKNVILASNESDQYRVETRLYEESALAEEDNSYQIVALIQPAAVDRLKAIVINSSCVNLTWSHTALGQEKMYKAYYRIVLHNRWREILLHDEEVDNYYALVCSLSAFTSYKFKIAVLPKPIETPSPTQGYLSEWKYVEATTREDVPASSPEICSGCFYNISCSNKTPRNHRCLRIIWKDLSAKEKRGELTHYKVTALSEELASNKSFLFNVEHRNLTTVDIPLQESENFLTEILITPATKKGYAKQSSQLVLPAKSKMPIPPKHFLVEIDNDKSNMSHYYISWAALESNPKSGLKYQNVTIVWCQRLTDNVCKGNVNWITLGADVVTYELTLGVSNIMIGISAEIFDGLHMISSGITWANCIYQRNKVPLHPPKNVQMSSAHSYLKNSLHIIWQPFLCAEEPSFIIEYLVQYCPTNEGIMCNGPENTSHVRHDKNEVILENLKGNTKYKLNILAVSATGPGPSSETFIVDIKEAPPDLETIPVSFIIGSILVTVLILLLLFFFWSCWKRRKIFKNFTFIPELNNQTNHGCESLPTDSSILTIETVNERTSAPEECEDSSDDFSANNNNFQNVSKKNERNMDYVLVCTSDDNEINEKTDSNTVDPKKNVSKERLDYEDNTLYLQKPNWQSKTLNYTGNISSHCILLLPVTVSPESTNKTNEITDTSSSTSESDVIKRTYILCDYVSLNLSNCRAEIISHISGVHCPISGDSSLTESVRVTSHDSTKSSMAKTPRVSSIISADPPMTRTVSSSETKTCSLISHLAQDKIKPENNSAQIILSSGFFCPMSSMTFEKDKKTVCTKIGSNSCGTSYFNNHNINVSDTQACPSPIMHNHSSNCLVQQNDSTNCSSRQNHSAIVHNSQEHNYTNISSKTSQPSTRPLSGYLLRLPPEFYVPPAYSSSDLLTEL